jgi:hypothetical protein
MTTFNLKKEFLFNNLSEGINKVKSSEQFQAFLSNSKRYLNKAYTITKSVVKGQWKNVSIAAVSVVAAGAVTSGLGSAILLGSLFYSGAKTLSYYLQHKQGGLTITDIGVNLLIEASAGLVYAAVAYGVVFYGGTMLITGLGNVSHLLFANWEYILYLVMA